MVVRYVEMNGSFPATSSVHPLKKNSPVTKGRVYKFVNVSDVTYLKSNTSTKTLGKQVSINVNVEKTKEDQKGQKMKKDRTRRREKGTKKKEGTKSTKIDIIEQKSTKWAKNEKRQN